MTTVQEQNQDLAPRVALRLTGWLVLGMVIVATLLMLLPSNPYYRWQQGDGTILFRARYIYERIHFDPQPIDVAIIGSSRIEASVRADELSAGLSRNIGRPVRAVNFGLPQEGRDLQWAVAKEVFEERSELRLVIFILGPEQVISHPGFRFLGDNASIAGAPIIYNPSYVQNLLTLPYRQLTYFIQSLAPWIFQLSADFNPKIYAARSFDPAKTFKMPDGTVVNRNLMLRQNQAALPRRNGVSGRFADSKLILFGLDQRYAIERHYIRKIASLAKRQHVQIAFLSIPPYRTFEILDDKAFYTRLGPILEGVPTTDDPENYMDTGHLNRTGTAKLSPWLVNRITPLLRKAEDKR